MTLPGLDQDLIVRNLLTALAESQADLATGRFVVESPEQHLARIKADLPQD